MLLAPTRGIWQASVFMSTLIGGLLPLVILATPPREPTRQPTGMLPSSVFRKSPLENGSKSMNQDLKIA